MRRQSPPWPFGQYEYFPASLDVWLLFLASLTPVVNHSWNFGD